MPVNQYVPPRVVIPVVAGIGNALMAVPMVRQLKHALPLSHITILARTAAMGQVFDRLPEVDHVRVMRRSAVGMGMSMLEISRQVHPDVLIIPFPSNRWQYGLLALASGADRRIMHSYPCGRFTALGFLPADRLPAVRGLHDVAQNLYLLRKLDIEPDITEAPRFDVNDADRAAAAQLLHSAGINDDLRPIAVHPGSARTILAQAKRWPASSYAQLVEQLADQFDQRIIILEGPDEAGVGEEIMARLRHPVARVLRLRDHLGTAAAVLQRAEFYVGSDSGLAHLAAAVGTPPVTLFGPADPERVCPFGYRHLVVQTPADCAPCFLYPWQATSPKIQCTSPTCIQQVTVEHVLAMCQRLTSRQANAAVKCPPLHTP